MLYRVRNLAKTWFSNAMKQIKSWFSVNNSHFLPFVFTVCHMGLVACNKLNLILFDLLIRFWFGASMRKKYCLADRPAWTENTEDTIRQMQTDIKNKTEIISFGHAALLSTPIHRNANDLLSQSQQSRRRPGQRLYKRMRYDCASAVVPLWFCGGYVLHSLAVIH